MANRRGGCDMENVIIRANGEQIIANVAKGLWSQIKGLMFERKKKNMLFVFPYKNRWSFWMFGVAYPLQIIFMDENKRVLEVQYAQKMAWHPRTWKIYKPKEPCKYVLECAYPLDVSPGDVLEWKLEE